MAPYVGVSLETFTAIIGTVLAGIAAGSWWGGKLADRLPPRSLLGPFLAAGGIAALIAPPIVTAVGPTFSGGDPLAIVILTATGFLLPAILLSTVTPIVAKLQLQTLDETGSVVGQLSAVGTAGALVGTFVTGFVLLAAWPSRPIVLAVGASLVALGVILGMGRYSRRLGLWLTGAVVAGLLTVVVPGPCEIETAYVCAQVQTDPARPSGRVLVLDTLRHSYVDLDDPTFLEFRYIELIADVITANAPDGPLRVLYLGGGGMTLPQWLAFERPGSVQTVLELDPVLVELARSELGLEPHEADVIETGDARITIRRVPHGAFQVVVGDAFGGSTVPWHLTTEEYLIEVKARMTPDGLYVMNVIDYQPLGFARAQVATLQSVFAEVQVIAPAEYLFGVSGGNFILVASDDPLDEERLSEILQAKEASSVVLSGEDVSDWVGDAQVLTDDFAPVDQLRSRPAF